jgi:multidrug efflux pump subunit AcrA (membrane-fusion protein)
MGDNLMRKQCALALLLGMALICCPLSCKGKPTLRKPEGVDVKKNASLREQVENLRGLSGRIEVPTLKATTDTISAELSITGELTPIKSIIVKPLMDGTISFVRPIKVGDMVNEGELLAKIDDRDIEDEIEQQKRQIAISKETLQLDDSELTRKQKDLAFDRTLVSEGFMNENELQKTEQDLRRAEIALRQSRLRLEQEENKLQKSLRKREKVPIKAPISGMVVLASHLTNRTGVSDLLNEEIMALDGTMVGMGTELFGIVSQDGFIALCQVNSKDKAHIKVGQKASITVISHKAVVVLGEVAKIAQLQEQKSHAYKVWLKIEKMDKSFTSGLFVRANIELERSEGNVVIPKEYVKERDNNQFVQVVKNDVITDVIVTTGITSGGNIEVKTGLAPGALIVASDKVLNRDQAVKPVELKKEKVEEVTP